MQQRDRLVPKRQRDPAERDSELGRALEQLSLVLSATGVGVWAQQESRGARLVARDTQKSGSSLKARGGPSKIAESSSVSEKMLS